MIEPIIQDNFFGDPDRVREHALKQNYLSSDFAGPDINYPGKRSLWLSAIDNYLFIYLTQKIYKILGFDPNTSSYTEAFYQWCSKDDGNSWVHWDNLPWNPTHVGVVYLTPDPPDNSGTILYHKPDNFDPDTMLPGKYNFEVKQKLDNKYNRIVIYDPKELHKSDTYFGTDINDSRLFIVFFMRIDEVLDT